MMDGMSRPSWDGWEPWMDLGRSHRVEINGGPGRGRYGARCMVCPWTVGQHFTSRDEAKERAAAHLAFTKHWRPPVEPEGLAPAERLAYRLAYSKAEALRHLGSPSPDIELRP